MANKITVDGIEITVVKKRIKNMYLRVYAPNGRVQVTAPKAVSDETIRAFILSKLAWIEKQRQFAVEPEQNYLTGESVWLWGKRYTLKLCQSDGPEGVYLSGGEVIMNTHGDRTKREKLLNEWYRSQLKDAIPAVLERCERVAGVKAAECRIKNMRTRWGSCNTGHKRVWLSLQLALKPPACLAYVITHELVHLKEKSHNAHFKRLMDEYYPDWRQVNKFLNLQAEPQNYGQEA